MSRFLPRDVFAPSERSALQLLPLRFERLEPGRVAVANLVGDIVLLSDEQLHRLVALDIHPGDGLYERACEKLLVSHEGDKAWLQILAMRMRSRMAYLSCPTALHIFVVTLRCEHSCPYCQVSRRSTDADAFDMSES